MTVSTGDKIVGSLTCAPNARNNRDLDISITYKVEGDETESKMDYKMCVNPPLSTFDHPVRFGGR